MRSTGAVKILPGVPDMPPNWSPDRQRRMRKAVLLTLRYLRVDGFNWEQIAEEMAGKNGHSWTHPKTGKVYAVSHQYVSQILAKGMRYLQDRACIIDVKTGAPIMRSAKSKKRKQQPSGLTALA